MAVVTALWHLERKPPIPMVNQTGCLTLLFRFKRRADFHGTTRDETLTPLGRPRGTPRSLSALERNPEIPPQLQIRTWAPSTTAEASQGLLATRVEIGPPQDPAGGSLKSPS